MREFLENVIATKQAMQDRAQQERETRQQREQAYQVRCDFVLEPMDDRLGYSTAVLTLHLGSRGPTK